MSKSAVSEEFKLWNLSRNMGNNRTNTRTTSAELHDYFDKTFGVNKGKGGIWQGITFIREIHVDDIVNLATA